MYRKSYNSVVITSLASSSDKSLPSPAKQASGGKGREDLSLKPWRVLPITINNIGPMDLWALSHVRLTYESNFLTTSHLMLFLRGEKLVFKVACIKCELLLSTRQFTDWLLNVFRLP